jgi:hypothetical protein
VGTAIALLGGLLWLLAEGDVGLPALLRSAAWGLAAWLGCGLIWIGLEYGQGYEDARERWSRIRPRCRFRAPSSVRRDREPPKEAVQQLTQSIGQKGGAQMNRTRSFAKGVALSLMLGMVLTSTVPAVGLQTASAQDQAEATVDGQSFRVDWTVSPDGQDKVSISGYVYNDNGDPAEQVQLRITELDASGLPGASVVTPIDETVPAFDRAYFDVQVPGPAASYRVAVESFSLLEGVK